MGSTLSVSTSANCSIQVSICDNSPASGPRSASGTLIRARAAICATVALSNAMM
jgi:hypothetical protein